MTFVWVLTLVLFSQDPSLGDGQGVMALSKTFPTEIACNTERANELAKLDTKEAKAAAAQDGIAGVAIQPCERVSDPATATNA